MWTLLQIEYGKIKKQSKKKEFRHLFRDTYNTKLKINEKKY